MLQALTAKKLPLTWESLQLRPQGGSRALNHLVDLVQTTVLCLLLVISSYSRIAEDKAQFLCS